MAQPTIELLLSVKDKLTTGMGKVRKALKGDVDTMGRQLDQFAVKQHKAFSDTKAIDLTTKSISELQDAIQALSLHRDRLVDPDEIAAANRQLDQMIAHTEKMKKLGTEKKKPTNWQQFKGSIKDAIPGGELLKNPYAAVTAGITALGAAAYKAGEHLFNVSSEIKEQQQQVAASFGVQGDALKDITARSGAMAKVLKTDFDELTESANVFFKEYKDQGATAARSLDLIKDGLIATNGKLDLDGIKEYSSQMKELGLDQERLIALQVKAYQGGYYQDKPLDALKEAGLSVREMDKAQQEALAGIGVNYKNLMADLNSGKKTGFDIVKEITTKMNATTDVAKRQKAIADIFKGAGEDAGQRFFKELLSTELSMESVLKNNPFVKAQQERIRLETELNKKIQEFAPTFNGISKQYELLTLKGKAFFYDVVAKATGWIERNKGTLGEIVGLVKHGLTPAFTMVKLAVGTVWQGVKTTFDGIWKGVQLVNSAFVGLRKLTDWVIGGIGQGVDWLYNYFGGEGSLMEKLFGNGDSIWGGIKGFFDKFGEKLKNVTKLSETAFSIINNALRGNFGEVKKGWAQLKTDWGKLGMDAPEGTKSALASDTKKTKKELSVPKKPTATPPPTPTAPGAKQPSAATVVNNSRQAHNININVDALQKGDVVMHTHKTTESMSAQELKRMMSELFMTILNDTQRGFAPN